MDNLDFLNRPEDFALIDEIKRLIREREKVGCTGCGYCMPCPKGVDIPGNFRCYNVIGSEGRMAAWMQFVQTVGLTREPAFASQCVRCGKCEQHCPQGVPIRDKLREADRALRPLPIRAAISFVRRLMFHRQKV